MAIAKFFAFHTNAKKKKKQTRMAIAKLFAFHANAKMSDEKKHTTMS